MSVTPRNPVPPGQPVPRPPKCPLPVRRTIKKNVSWTLFYDGGCNLCHASQLRLVQWAARAGQPLDAFPLQSIEALDRGYLVEAMILEADGKVLRAEAAWLYLMRIAPWYLRWVGWLGQVPGFRQILGWGYRVVAKYRLKWFGSRACPIPQRKPN